MLGSERGQTIPFWTFALIAMLAMMLFTWNTAMQVTWNIRAQSAADSAAATGLSVTANIWNEESTILYATAVDEYRLRALNMAILNTINHNGGCTSGAAGTCASDYAVLTAAFNKALASYLKDVQLLGQADQFTEGGQQQDQQKAINGFGSNCGGGSGAGIDCNFAYTMLGAGNGNGNGNGNGGNHNEFQPPPTVEVIACRNVSYMGAPLLTLGSTTFQAVAHSAASVLTAQTQTFTPTAAQQPVEARWYNGTTLPLATAPYEVSFQGTGGTAFAVTVNWYTSVPSNPTLTASKAGSYSCK